MKIIEEKYAWRSQNFKTNKPDTIVIHHALSPRCTAQDVHRWHLARGWQGIAYHYFVRKDGTVYRGRQETQVGGHLLGSENDNTIGICLEGCYTDYKKLTEKTVPEAQMNALVELCSDIKTRWNIKVIRRHADFPSAQKEGKDCPGKYFPWAEFLQELTGMNIRTFQTAAKSIGLYDFTVDGVNGPRTKAAAKAFLPVIVQILGLDFRNAAEVIKATQESPQHWLPILQADKYFEQFIMNIINKFSGKE
jgi:N-acetyl-anhydromuramyl-L-alanine amidase AmpD